MQDLFVWLISPPLSFCGALPTRLFPSPSLLFYSPPFNSWPTVPLTPLFPFISPSPSIFVSRLSAFLGVIFTYVFVSHFFLSPQGSVREAGIFGLEPHSVYSLRVEAVNSAGGVFLWFVFYTDKQVGFEQLNKIMMKECIYQWTKMTS